MAVARAALLQPQYLIDSTVTQAALVVGGGAAGMAAALSLADQGFPVYLVEREAEIGGNLRFVFTQFDDEIDHPRSPKEVLKKLRDQVAANKLITLCLESQIIGTKGSLGRFTSMIQSQDGTRQEIRHGITILATGGQEYRGPEYGYGSDPRVITQQQFENLVAHQPEQVEQLNSFAMILCVGPAEEYCSRICCTVAIKNALEIKRRNPAAQITLFYKDIRTYGFKEKLYTRARQEGILFVRYDDQHPLQISYDEHISIQAHDLNLHQPILIHPDLVVLAMPVVPQADGKSISTLFKAPVDEHGFFIEAHVKLRPVDFATNGLFMAGMAHYPKLLDESMIQAQAAAARAARLLSRDSMLAGGQIAVVDESRCTACLTCVRICPYGVPQIQVNRTGIGNILGAAFIEPSICQGCGSCASECPAHAIELKHYTDAQMMAKINSLIHPESIVAWQASIGD